MVAPRQETLARLTDIVADKVLARLGTSGTGLADDLADRLQVQVLPIRPGERVGE